MTDKEKEEKKALKAKLKRDKATRKLQDVINKMAYDKNLAKHDKSYAKKILKLIEEGADIEAKGWMFGAKYTPLQLIAKCGINLENSECFRVLSGNGADLTDALLYVSTPGQVTALVNMGADINKLQEKTGSNGQKYQYAPIVHYASHHNHDEVFPEIIKEFVENGADINVTSPSDYYTTVLEACGRENIEYVLKLGADPNVTKVVMNYDYTPANPQGDVVVPYVEIFMCWNDTEMIELLTKYGAKIPAEGQLKGRTLREMTPETREFIQSLKQDGQTVDTTQGRQTNDIVDDKEDDFVA